MSSYSHDNGAKPGVALAHTLHGAPANSQPANSFGPNVGRALHSTAPYKPPKRREKDNPDLVLCSVEGCKGYPIKEHDYCIGHARSFGLVKGGCSVDGCKAPAMKETGYCYPHGVKQGLADVDAG